MARRLHRERRDYTHHIETKVGHIASIAGWSCPGTVCPTTTANARLIEHAPDLAFNLQQLLTWSRYMGDWHASCWDSAQRALDRALGDFITPGIGAVADTRSLLNETGIDRGWAEATELRLLIDFLDAEIHSDPRIAVRLEEHLRAAAA